MGKGKQAACVVAVNAVAAWRQLAADVAQSRPLRAATAAAGAFSAALARQVGLQLPACRAAPPATPSENKPPLLPLTTPGFLLANMFE